MTADELAQLWRVRKIAELNARAATIQAEIAAIQRGATPDTLAADAAAPPSAPTAPPEGAPDTDASHKATLPSPSAAPPLPPPTRKEGSALDKTGKGEQSVPGGSDADDGKRPFAGVKFGVGVSMTVDWGSRDRIGEAYLDAKNIVRVADKNNNPARVMLETHYFLTPCGRFLFRQNACEWRYDATGQTWKEAVMPDWGVGPFIALQPGGDEDVIDAIGMGLMVGFRRGDTSHSFNFGVGYVIDPNTKVLGSGIKEDMALPGGETEIRLTETSQSGLLFLASFSF